MAAGTSKVRGDPDLALLCISGGDACAPEARFLLPFCLEPAFAEGEGSPYANYSLSSKQF